MSKAKTINSQTRQTAGNTTGDNEAADMHRRPAILRGAALQFPDNAPETLTEALSMAAATDQAIVFVNGGNDEDVLSYHDLLQKATTALGALQALGADPGKAVILQLDELDEFLISFWACILGRLVPVPVLPFRNMDAGDSSFTKLQTIAAQLDQPIILMSEKNAQAVRAAEQQAGAANACRLKNCRIDTFNNISHSAKAGIIFRSQPNDLAFLQYTSGSTSFPKGVQISHKNVLSTIYGMSTALGITTSSCLLNWMPFYHDMGIIAGHLMAVVNTCKVVAMKPFTFVRRPLLWLEKINEHRANITFSPNFGLKRILEKARPGDISTLDLSCLDVILNGAEPISVQTSERFLELLSEHCGLNKHCLLAGYGLAEASLAVTIAPRGHTLRKHILNRERLGNGACVEPVSATDSSATWFADEGPVVNGIDLRIVNDNDEVVPVGTVGHVQISGQSVTRGYYANKEANQRSFCDQWFRTGDLGFVLDDRFVITGRVKDIVFANGQNYYSHDFEHTCENIQGLERLVVIGHYNHDLHKEEILAFIACNKQYTGAREKTAILRKVQMRINQCFDVTPTQFVLLKSAGEIPKTTSGKIIRHKLLENYLQGQFNNQCIQLAELLEIAPDLSSEADAGKHVTIAELKLLIRHLWSDVLGISQKAIGDHDPFFSLGGTSIKAIEVVSLADETFECAMTHEMLKEHDTIHKLANHMARGNISIRCNLNKLVKVEPKQQEEDSLDISEALTTANDDACSTGIEIRDDDIAIVGMGCVFPQADNVDEFWQLLMEGRDCVSEFPNDRGNIHQAYDKQSGTLNKTVSKWGSFVDNHHFDPKFFNMSEDEAITMDPHQRIFLNAAWQAIQDSGLVGFEGSNMGVFVGASGTGFYQQREDDQLTPSLLTGSLANLAASRVSHAFNLKGTSLSVDTACSSSLASVDLACKSILNGESEIALAGGVQVMESLTFYLLFSRAGILSPQGRCFTFSDKANGFVPGEGAGAVVLKRYSQAVADGDRVYAVIKASAMNNDGSSLGIMAPNPEGQEHVIRTALQQADINPADIGYVEAHGTGTDIGDLIEVRSLSLAFNEGQPVANQSCGIGSVKTNLGHQLAAAGISGLMKAALTVYHDQIPPTLNCETERKELKLAETPFFVCHKPTPWPKTSADSRRLAAVNSFGFGGTNAHVILSSAYHEAVHHQLPVVADEPQVFCLSAKSEASLDAARSAFVAYAGNCPDDTPIRDVAYTYGARRAHYRENRTAVVAHSLKDATALLSGAPAARASLFENRSLPRMRRMIAWLFSGQGSQHPAMGQQLFHNEPVFRDIINQCDEIARPLLGTSLRDLLVFSTTQQQVSSTAITQPLVFTMDYALARLWQSWGCKPDFMLGHSIGEYVAACLGDVFSIEDALAIVIKRGALMGALPLGGGMTAVLLGADELKRHISELGLPLDISAYNGTMSTAVSGDSGALDALHARLDEQAVAYTRLTVSHAFHSRLMDPVLDEFNAFMTSMNLHCSRTPIISNVTGKLYQGDETSAEYWVKHIRNPVQFHKGVNNLVAANASIFLEIGAQAHLTGLTRRIVKGNDAVILSSLPKNSPDANAGHQLAIARASLYSCGVDIDWNNFYAAHGERRFRTTTPPGGEERRDRRKTKVAGGHLQNAPVYPLERRSMFRVVGNRKYPFRHMFKQLGDNRYKYVPDPDSVLFRDHVISRIPMLSAAGQCDLVSYLHMLSFSHAPKCLRNISFHQPWLGNSDISVSFTGDKEKTFSITDAKGRVVFKGHSNTQTQSVIPPALSVRQVEQQLPLRFNQDVIYNTFKECGIEYGPFHRNITSMLASETEVLARLSGTRGETAQDTHGYYFHPGILDSAFQAAAGLLLAQVVDDNGQINAELPLMVPLGIDSICVYKFIQNGGYYSHVTLDNDADTGIGNDIINCNIRLYDENGSPCAAIQKLQMKRMPVRRASQVKKSQPEHIQLHTATQSDSTSETAEFFHTVWKAQPPVCLPHRNPSSRWLVFGSPLACEQQLAPAVAEWGVNSILVPYEYYRSADEPAMAAIFEKSGPINGIVFLGDYDRAEKIDDAADIDTMRILFNLLKTVSKLSRKDKALRKIRIIRATRNAYRIEGSDNPPDIQKSVVTGFLRSARTEFPLMDIRQLEFGNTDDSQLAACLNAELASSSTDSEDGPETLYHNGQRHSLMVEPVTLHHCYDRTRVFNQDKVFWIIGATSGVGKELARYLASHYQCSLMLSGSRRLPDAGEYNQYIAEHTDSIAETIKLIREIEALGSSVLYVSTDVRSADSIRVSLDTIRSHYSQLDGIYFGALQLDDKMIVQKEWPDYRNMMDMRVRGLNELIRQTETDKLEFFALFSSLAGVTGNIGQTDYAASTVYMDMIPYVQPAGNNCRFISIQWGPWALGQQASEVVQDHLRRNGFLQVTVQLGMEALEKLILSKQKNVAFVPGSEHASHIAKNINSLRQGLGTRSGQQHKAQSKQVEEHVMSNTPVNINSILGDSNQLQLLTGEFEKQREMLMKLCESQNALLAGTLAGLPTNRLAAITEHHDGAISQPTPVPVPEPAPLPLTESVPVQAAPETLVADMYQPAPSPEPVPAAIEVAEAAAPAQTAVTDNNDQGLPPSLFVYVRSLMAKAVEMPETDIDPDQNIMELGADSMTAMSLVKEMETRYNIELPATLLFEYSTLNELVDFLKTEVGDTSDDDNAQQA